MKIIVSQQGKKIIITFKNGKVVDKYRVDKAEEFLLALDKFFRRRNISPISHIGQIGHISPIRHMGKIGRIEFENTGVLTERVIRSIMLGLRFSCKLA